MLTPDDLSQAVLVAAAGDAWYGASTAELLEGISQEEASSRPIPGAHSIAEIVHHMASWAAEVERRLAGGEPIPPREGDWPAGTEGHAVCWSELLDGWLRANEALAARIAEFEAARWSDHIGGERDAPLGTGVTYGEMILGVVQHNAYHSGQIALLRRAIRERA